MRALAAVVLAAVMACGDAAAPTADDGLDLTAIPEPGRVAAVAHGPVGFVAVGADLGDLGVNEDDTAVVWTSKDGATWERLPTHASFRDSGMRSVTWFAAGELFVAVGTHVSAGAVWASPDGARWERVALLEPSRRAGGIEMDLVEAVDGRLLASGREFLGEGEPVPARWESNDGRTWAPDG